MTHAAEMGTTDRLHFLAPVSGTCVMQIWYTRFRRRLEHYSKPESGDWPARD